MATELTSVEWVRILKNNELTSDLDVSIFQALYSFQDHKAPASQVGLLLGNKGKNPASPLNLEIGRYAKRIANHYDIDFTIRSNQKYKFWDLFFNGWTEGQFFIWQLRPELKTAIEQSGLSGEEQFPEELPSGNENEIIHEGLKRTITVNTYERNPKARKECIAYWKPVCTVCSFNFEMNNPAASGRGIDKGLNQF